MFLLFFKTFKNFEKKTKVSITLIWSVKKIIFKNVIFFSFEITFILDKKTGIKKI